MAQPIEVIVHTDDEENYEEMADLQSNASDSSSDSYFEYELEDEHWDDPDFEYYPERHHGETLEILWCKKPVCHCSMCKQLGPLPSPTDE